MNILVIEDEQSVRESIESLLTRENYQVDCCSTSNEGLNRAVDGHYDLILAEIRMPETGGMRLLRDIKRAKPSLPVIMITGSETLQSAVQAMQLGATNFIEKPCTPDELINAVTVGLKAGRSTAPVEQVVINKEKLLQVLERAAHDSDFVTALHQEGADALKNYTLTAAEKLALLTGDIPWIEEHVGELTEMQKRWFQQRLSAEIW